MPDLPLEAATADIIARYKRGNDMLASAAIALRKLKERIDAGEAGPEWDWASYRTMHLEPHIGVRWLQVQLKLAPSGATDSEVAKNVDRHRESGRNAVVKHREEKKSRELRNSPTQSPDPHPGAAASAEGGSEIPPLAPAEPVTPRGRSQGGDSVVIPDDGLQGHYREPVFYRTGDEDAPYQDSAAIHEALALADSSHEGMIAIWVDPHNPMSMFSTGLMLAMDGSTTVNITDAAAEWSENMVLRTNELHDFIDLLIEFEAAYRAQHGNGNAADLGTDAAQ
jgi:hypothetical protein